MGCRLSIDATGANKVEGKHWNTYIKSDEDTEVLVGTIGVVSKVSCTDINNVDGGVYDTADACADTEEVTENVR